MYICTCLFTRLHVLIHVSLSYMYCDSPPSPFVLCGIMGGAHDDQMFSHVPRVIECMEDDDDNDDDDDDDNTDESEDEVDFDD